MEGMAGLQALRDLHLLLQARDRVLGAADHRDLGSIGRRQRQILPGSPDRQKRQHLLFRQRQQPGQFE